MFPPPTGTDFSPPASPCAWTQGFLWILVQDSPWRLCSLGNKGILPQNRLKQQWDNCSLRNNLPTISYPAIQLYPSHSFSQASAPHCRRLPGAACRFQGTPYTPPVLFSCPGPSFAGLSHWPTMLCSFHPRFSRPTWAKPWAAQSDPRAGRAWGRGWNRALLKLFQPKLNPLIKPTQDVTSQEGACMKNSVHDSGQKTFVSHLCSGRLSVLDMGASHLTWAPWRFSTYSDCSCPAQSVEELETTRVWTTAGVWSPWPKTWWIPLGQSGSFSKDLSSSPERRL